MTLSKTLLLSSLIFLAASPVQAENNIQNKIEERREVRQEIQENRQEVRQENIENRQETRQENKDNRLELRRQNAIKISNNLVAKLEKRFEYLEKIKARLQLKINSLKATRDMTEAQAKLDSYNPGKYTTDLEALYPIIASIGTVDKPSSVVPTLREASKLVIADLKGLHQILVDTLKLVVKSPKITSIPTLSP